METRSNKTLTETEFHMTWELLLNIARMAQLIEVDTVHKVLNTIAVSHAMGPIIDPTKYRDVGMDNLHEQQVLAEGFLAFRKSIEDVRQYAIANGLIDADK